jgi:hypothetical protein
MATMDQLISSNLFQTAALLAISVICFFFLHDVVLKVLAYSVVFFISASFIFDIGEVYSYSPWYKRAFWYFGDDVTTWIVPLFFFAALRRWRILSTGLAGAAFMSGGRIGLLLLIVQAAITIWLYRKAARTSYPQLMLPLVAGLAIYFGTLTLSPLAIDAANSVHQLVTQGSLRSGTGTPFFAPTTLGTGSCTNSNCFQTKVKRPLRIRALSASAGLWMTLQGGFPGDLYPNTPEKFSDLIWRANPWGINERFEVSREEWAQIGAVQTPYLQFGSGYGPLLLAVVMGFIAAVCLAGIYSVRRAMPNACCSLTLFFIINAIVNQTQAWLIPGPVLFAMGLCGSYILWEFVRFRGTPTDARHIRSAEFFTKPSWLRADDKEN